MKKRKIDGIATLKGGEYGDIAADGVLKISGRAKCGVLVIDGVLNAKGDLECSELHCDGMMKVDGALKSGLADVDGKLKTAGDFICSCFKGDEMVTVGGSVIATRIDVDGILTAKGEKISATQIECDGIISADGEITADRIEADGYINSREITGEQIIIRSRGNWWARLIGKRSRIELIEADRIALREVRANEVNGTDLRIDSGCKIAKIDCSGTLWISPRAKVGKVSGHYTTVNTQQLTLEQRPD